jgi:tetratricopeptide (TPR) repeat protein
MKTKWIATILSVAGLLALSAASLHAQAMAKIAGKVTDTQGKPMPGASIEIRSEDTGSKYTTKTDKSGNYFQIGVYPGSYTVRLIENGKEIFHFNHVPVHLNPDDSPTEVDFDLKKELAAQQGQGGGQAAAQSAAEKQAAQQAEQQRTKIAGLNQQLTQATADEQAGQWDQAVSILTQATTAAPTEPILWAHLGQAELGAGGAAAKSGDKAGATADYEKAVDAYQKAVQLKPTDPNYHNNLGQAYAKSGKPQQAVQEYTTAAQESPTNAAMFYFNLGATLTNQATMETNQDIKTKDIDAADEAFDKAIQANPTYGEAWYQKGVNLLSKATYDKSGKIIPAPGTAEAFQKYLEVAPTGPHAEEAKSMITSLGEKVETSYKKPKSK